VQIHDPNQEGPPRHELFSSVAGVYARHRPGYPEALLAGVKARLAAGRRLEVLDWGAGTGLSSRAWAERGHRVVALDPSGAMLGESQVAEARRKAAGEAARGDSPAVGERVLAVRGAAERLPFAAGAFDLIVGHQCFHWFELGASVAEIGRVGRSHAWAAAVWNTRRASGLAGEYERILRRHSRIC
jgi:SAM-dependent methyltransferase